MPSMLSTILLSIYFIITSIIRIDLIKHYETLVSSSRDTGKEEILVYTISNQL